MTQEHPITPPPKLVHQWHKEACKDPYNGGTFFESKTLKHIATQAARWGADEQLEQDARWLDTCALFSTHLTITPSGDALRQAMRFKPPSLKEQALEILEINNDVDSQLNAAHYNILRLALQSLPD